MNESDLLNRLTRLEGYLRQDPANPRLLEDSFDTALSAAAWERAEFHLRNAQALGLDKAAWSLREAHWLMAQHRWEDARNALTALETETSGQECLASLAADQAYIDLRLGDLVSGIARLQPWMIPGSTGADTPPALEVMWVRLLHRDRRLDDALAWARGREAQGMPLSPATAGVASLVALDAGAYEDALRWSEAGLRTEDPVVESYVARASLALSEQNPVLAKQLLQPARASNERDGRTWSALGFAELLGNDLPAARSAFDRAVTLMAEHVGTWHGLGWTTLAQRDLSAARRAFESAIERDRNVAESYGALAVVCVLEGNQAAARHSIDIALRLDRQCLSARYAEALLSGEASDTRSLMRLAERLLKNSRTPAGLAVSEILRQRVPSDPT